MGLEIVVKKSLIISSTVLVNERDRQTDRQTDGQTEGQNCRIPCLHEIRRAVKTPAGTQTFSKRLVNVYDCV